MKAQKTLNRLLPLILVLCLHMAGYSQAPQGFSYQAVIRNSDGTPIASQSIKVHILLTNQLGTTTHYGEEHTLTTTPQGLANLIIGTGNSKVGTLAAVPWQSGDIYIKVEVDPTGTGGYQSMGNPVKLNTVPYALFAENAKEIVSPPGAPSLDPIFAVKNSLNQTVFAVYQSGVGVYVANAVKGAKGGFAVGGLTSKGGTAVDYFNVSPSNTPDLITNSAQMLWYPLKEAFLVGRVEVLDPNDVGLNSFSSGYLSKAKGDYSQAMGTNSVASGNYSTAIGESCFASGQYSFAFGSNAQATNTNNIAIGYQTESSGTSDCYAFGKQAKVLSNSSNSYAFGNSAQVLSYSTNSYALGNTSLVTGSTDCYAFGTNASVSGGLNSYAIGSNSKVAYGSNTAWGSYAIGDNAECYGQRAYALGSHARALNNDAIAFGTNTKSTAYVSIAIGANGSNADTTYATGQASIAMGYAANSGGLSSISLGTRSIASSNYSVAIGNQAEATAINATAIGNGAISNTANKVRIGNSVVSVIEGQVAFTSASDMRLKKNIKVLNSGLDFIMKLRPVEYQMTKGDNKINYGFIAQDIEQIVGTDNSILTIGTDPDRTLGLRYTDFIAPLVKALQEQQLQIEELKQKNDELNQLKAQYNTLKTELDQIKVLLKK